MEKNEFQNRIFLFSNFLGAAILNNCDKELLSYNKRATISGHKKDGGAQEICKQKYAILKFGVEVPFKTFQPITTVVNKDIKTESARR